EAETAREDLEIRTEVRNRLTRDGVREVWVTPQVPFVALISAGVGVGILAGNLIFLFWGAL
ncbi:MAG: peptidase A24, partial [Thermoplasmata archaeon]